jgi:hypothetical protein
MYLNLLAYPFMPGLGESSVLLARRQLRTGICLLPVHSGNISSYHHWSAFLVLIRTTSRISHAQKLGAFEILGMVRWKAIERGVDEPSGSAKHTPYLAIE